MKNYLLSVLLYSAIFCVVLTSENYVCPKIKSKQQWEGVTAKKVSNQTAPIPLVIIHHTVSNACESFIECVPILQNIQSYHILKKGFNDIGYNFLIGNDGLIYEGCGWNIVGNHTRGYNLNSLGVAFIGNFTSHLPSPNAFNSLKNLLRCGVNLGELSPNYKILAARQVSNTISPGLPIFGEIQEWDNWLQGTYFEKYAISN
ncbi:peptidoglycan-recognition protein SA-like [Episyrphus balteatus]|uniref:peptidoglycan-recognition protein SA-like n=1 Tax=Episyrphus balteatus TaxID=286459 RepID=UPI0024859541|nr:peptidoglycan-recognition protein SA-like [Episyrphus balteatus]